MALDDDPEPIDRPTAADAVALERLLHAYRSQVEAYLAQKVPGDLRRIIDTQDVLQETYFEAFRRLGEFASRGPGALRSWLPTIARNKLINLINSHRAAKRGGGRIIGEPFGRDGDDGDGMLVPWLEQLAVYERTPSKSAIAHELAAALERSIDRLPGDYRQAIRLRYIERLAVSEIAAAMSRTEAAVHMVCNRALRALRCDLRSASLYV